MKEPPAGGPLFFLNLSHYVIFRFTGKKVASVTVSWTLNRNFVEFYVEEKIQ